MKLKGSPPETSALINWPFLAYHPRIRRIMERILVGSTGAEIWSAVTIIVLGAIVLTPPPDARGLLMAVLTHAIPLVTLGFLVFVGGGHLVALSSRLSLYSIAFRKIATAIEVTAWTTVLYDMMKFGQIGSAVSLAVLVILLYVALLRRRYLT